MGRRWGEINTTCFLVTAYGIVLTTTGLPTLRSLTVCLFYRKRQSGEFMKRKVEYGELLVRPIDIQSFPSAKVDCCLWFDFKTKYLKCIILDAKITHYIEVNWEVSCIFGPLFDVKCVVCLRWQFCEYYNKFSWQCLLYALAKSQISSKLLSPGHLAANFSMVRIA